MRITEISATSLFDIFNHTIALNVDDGITIIHGPNGYGKSIMLRVLSGLFNRRYAVLHDIPFQKFQVRFDDESLVWVEKKCREKAHQNGNEGLSQITINYSKPNATQIKTFSLNSIPQNRVFLSMLAEKRTKYDVAGVRELAAISNGAITSDYVLEHNGYIRPFEQPEEPQWWREIQQAVNIVPIETPTLLNIYESNRHNGRSQGLPLVEQYSKELVEIIQQKLAESAALSQSLDRTFPMRLVEQMAEVKITNGALQDKLTSLERKRSELKEVGLLDQEENHPFLPIEKMADDARNLLGIYVQDVEQKLSVFDDISDRLTLLKEIINKHFLHKRFNISKEEGFFFTNSKGRRLTSAELSLGEQHQLALLYQMLFKASPDSLLLIDEPERSLHVVWQRTFLAHLQRIKAAIGFDVIIATHSPQIVHDRWDLTVELKGPKIG
ncbi:MAG: AAA family ATPase [Ardenticatenaceae bacterium]